MKVCVFEDSKVSNLSPINNLRHTSEIICGAFTILEKINNFLPNKLKVSALHCRQNLSSYLKEKFPDLEINEFEKEDYLFLNSRVLFSKDALKRIISLTNTDKNTAMLSGDNVIAFHITYNYKPGLIKEIQNNLISESLVKNADLYTYPLSEEDNVNIINYPWDFINYHDKEIRNDLSFLLKKKKQTSGKFKRVDFIKKKKIIVSRKSKISPKVVLNADKGIIFISDGTIIEPFTYIEGPVFIGKNSTIKSGTKIYGPVRIGSNCKISGEITSSIIHSYVNKQHLGFLGHSYICDWVNLGAGTITSNLKNNYSNITVKLDKVDIDTNSIFLGSIIGDHTKTGINTMLNTGSIIGISSNLYGDGFHNKLIKSFSWMDAGSKQESIYDIEKALNTARLSMARRNEEMNESYEKLFKETFYNRDKNSI
ncbi:MAG: putative sugar nucleotidyl transferase [Ignavibacteria bacterium]